MTLNRCTRAPFALRELKSLKLECKTNRSNSTTAMLSNPRRIVCATVAFHQTCCSNASTGRESKAATGSIRSNTSGAKKRHCCTRPSGDATGSTHVVSNTPQFETPNAAGGRAGATKRGQTSCRMPNCASSASMAAPFLLAPPIVAGQMTALGYNAGPVRVAQHRKDECWLVANLPLIDNPAIAVLAGLHAPTRTGPVLRVPVSD